MTTTERRVVKPQNNTEHTRYYLNDKVVPGGSTIAKIGGDTTGMMHAAWKLGIDNLNYNKVWSEATAVGNIVHAIIEAKLDDADLDLANCVPKHIENAQQCAHKALCFIEEHNLTPVGIERQLVMPYPLTDFPEAGFGGTLDLVAYDKNSELWLVDWKTSKKIYPIPNHCQIAGYKALWNHHFPDQPIQKQVVVRLGKGDENDYDESWVKSTESAWRLFQVQLEYYYNSKAFLRE